MTHPIHFHSRAENSTAIPEPGREKQREKEVRSSKSWRFTACASGAVILLLIALVEFARARGGRLCCGSELLQLRTGRTAHHLAQWGDCLFHRSGKLEPDPVGTGC